MDIDHVHFYVEDASIWRTWSAVVLGFQPIATSSTHHTQTEVVQKDSVCFLVSSPLSNDSPVADYLRLHPPGIADLAFRVDSVEAVVDRAIASGAQVLHPIQEVRQREGYVKWVQIKGWGDLRHTLIERVGAALMPLHQVTARSHECNRYSAVLIPPSHQFWAAGVLPDQCTGVASTAVFAGIDHAVLNVAAGSLEAATAWYEQVFGFERQQLFAIQTDYSGLCSRVLIHPEGTAQFPINEPVSASSQIQEFLNVNRGSGVQHVALKTIDMLKAIAELRERGLSFLHVPRVYYEQLKQRPGFQLSEAQWRLLADQEVLIDWQQDNPDAILLQAFTQPIFKQPTFFFELIERQTYRANQQDKQTEGFGEGNFRALFEAIEREQMKREGLR